MPTSAVFPNYRLTWSCQCGAHGEVLIQNPGAPPGTTPVYGAFAAAIREHRKDPRQCPLKGGKPSMSILTTNDGITVHIGAKP